MKYFKNKFLSVSLAVVFSASIFLPQKAQAVCVTNPAQIVTTLAEMCWTCIFPINIAGIPVIQGPLPDSPLTARNPICVCPAPPPLFYRIGITIGYWEPSRSIDVSKDPYCFSGIGINLSMPMTQRGTKGQGIDRTRTYMHSHYYIYPIFEMIGMFVDSMCMRAGQGIDVAYMTEVDPLWNDDNLSAFINPEALLFGNPITNLACVADSISSQVYFPLDPLFWCKGSWGNAYPLSGNTNTKDFVEDNLSIAGSMIYKLHRQLILWNSAGFSALCSEHPMPIWFKSAYRLQPIYPIPHPIAVPIGQTGLVWSFGKNIPMVGDNFNSLLFKKVDCCAF